MYVGASRSGYVQLDAAPIVGIGFPGEQATANQGITSSGHVSPGLAGDRAQFAGMYRSVIVGINHGQGSKFHFVQSVGCQCCIQAGAEQSAQLKQYPRQANVVDGQVGDVLT